MIHVITAQRFSQGVQCLILKLLFCSFGVLSLVLILFVAGWLRLVSATRHIKPGPTAQIIEFPQVPRVP